MAEPDAEPLFGTTDDISVPDDVWTRAVEVALDPDAPDVDDSIVPVQEDTENIGEDEELVLDLDDGDAITSGDRGSGVSPHDDNDVPVNEYYGDATWEHDANPSIHDDLPGIDLGSEDL